MSSDEPVPDSESDRNSGSGLDPDTDPPQGEHRSLWLDTSPGTDYDPLDGDRRVDTAVVGGGIAGITAAFKLDEAGQSVALIERDRILAGVTGHTTAKLTSAHGLLYHDLLESVGPEQARQYARANEAAIDDVEATAEEHGIDCDFARTPAYTYTTDPGRRSRVREEVTAARRLGLPASYEESVGLPFDVEAAVRFADQARFHPRNYLLGLADRLHGDGSYVFEETTATDVAGGDPCRVVTERGTVVADDVVVATHFPVYDPALYFARLYPKRSYVVAARLREDVPEGLYYEPGDPYVSVRTNPTDDEALALVGGQNHRTGHGGSTAERYRALETFAREQFDVTEVEYRWATQDYVAPDRVPFVGQIAPHVQNVSVATGFGGWGMTNGTAAGRLLADRILGRGSPWADVFRPARLNLGASAGSLVDHNKHAARHFVGDRFEDHPPAEAVALDLGEATVVDTDDGPTGVYRDEDGELHAVSAVCPHMGCLVTWNDGDQSWDCPCHGSRFDYDGSVLDTPAVEDLAPYEGTDLPAGER